MPILAENLPKPVGQSTRRHARTLFSVPFQLHHVDISGLRPVHAISLDLSEGGMGALVQGKMRIGEAVQIDLPLGKQTLNTMAIVRHSSTVRSGFEFLGLSNGDRQQITRLVGAA